MFSGIWKIELYATEQRRLDTIFCYIIFMTSMCILAIRGVNSVCEDEGKSWLCKMGIQCNKRPRMATSYLPVHQ